MDRCTLVVRRNGGLAHPRDLQRLLDRLAAQPGVLSVRVEAAPLCVVLSLVPQLADQASLRALVHAQRVEPESQVCARPRPPAATRPPSVPPPTALRLATSALLFR